MSGIYELSGKWKKKRHLSGKSPARQCRRRDVNQRVCNFRYENVGLKNAIYVICDYVFSQYDIFAVL